MNESQSLLNGCDSKGISSRGKSNVSKNGPVVYDTGTNGCLICKNDTHHDRLLICEFCNAEYHIYCLDPPLESVPEGDFFCGEFFFFFYISLVDPCSTDRSVTPIF